MKKLLGASGVGILLMALPSISSAKSGSFFYRSYDCTGANPTVTIDTNNNTPPSNNSGGNNNNKNTSNTNLNTDDNNSGGGNNNDGNNNDPQGNPSVAPVDQGGGGASVPAPAASEIAGAGVAMIAAYTWRRSRKLSRI